MLGQARQERLEGRVHAAVLVLRQEAGSQRCPFCPAVPALSQTPGPGSSKETRAAGKALSKPGAGHLLAPWDQLRQVGCCIPTCLSFGSAAKPVCLAGCPLMSL